jgi:hypothetical protein
MKPMSLTLVLCASVWTACGGDERPPRSDEGRPIKMVTVGAASTVQQR